MRVHFSAAIPCALRIGGAAAGVCGEAEKFADLPCGEELLVEFLPADGDYFPLSFIMSADFFARPPQGIEAYLYDCGADVRAARFAHRSPALRVLAQARAAGMLLTAFDWGGPRLCAEGRGFACLDLPSADVHLGEEHIGGEVFARALCRGGRADKLLLLAPDGTAAFDGDADAYACGEALRVEARLFDLCGHTLERTFRARGGRLIESGRALRAARDKKYAKILSRATGYPLAEAADSAGGYKDWCVDKLGITWQTLSDLKGIRASEIAKAYNVSGIPASFVISPDGKIIHRDLRGEQVLDTLSRYAVE